MVERQSTEGVLIQLGLPQSCLGLPPSVIDRLPLRRLTESHLDRVGETVRLRQVARPLIVSELLKLTQVPKNSPSCLNSVSSEGHRQLWRDLATDINVSTHEGALVPSFLEKGRQALRANQPSAAYQLCLEHAESQPQSGAARCAATAAQMQAMYPEAIRMWRAHLSFHPKDRTAILSLARCVGRSGDDDGARAILAIAIQELPDWADAYVELGIALYRLSQVRNARAAWQKALELDSKHEDALRLLKGY